MTVEKAKDTDTHSKSLPGGVTQGEVDKWKKKYGAVYAIDVPLSDEPGDTITCYLKEPTRQTLSAAMKFSSSDPMKMNDILLTNCWLGGDPRIQTNDKLFMSAAALLSEIYKIREAVVKKL